MYNNLSMNNIYEIQVKIKWGEEKTRQLSMLSPNDSVEDAGTEEEAVCYLTIERIVHNIMKYFSNEVLVKKARKSPPVAKKQL